MAICVYIHMATKLDTVGSEISYIPDFLGDNEIQELLDELLNDVPWTQGSYNMYGKTVVTPRLLYAMRDADKNVPKSYNVTDSMVWTPSVKKLRDKISAYTGRNITYAQLNYYRNGNDYIGPHADKEMADGDIIASISLGATRRFVFINKKHKQETSNIDLKSGSLLIMNDKAGKIFWKHALPRAPKITESRINITFRPK